MMEYIKDFITSAQLSWTSSISLKKNAHDSDMHTIKTVTQTIFRMMLFIYSRFQTLL